MTRNDAAKKPRCRGATDGFSTIEAIIAIGILGICLLPILDLQLAINDGTGRIERAAKQSTMQANIETYLRALPVEKLGDGDATFGKYNLSWSATNLSGPVSSLSEISASGRFELSLVRIDYSLVDAQSELISDSLLRTFWIEVQPYWE